jgi:peptide/nickel transport system substrate-binding protein
MDSTQRPQPFRKLTEAFRGGRISRRQFIEGSTALGVGAGVATLMANAVQASAAGVPMRNGWAFYQTEGGPAGIPRNGMDGVSRGDGGELRIIQWQAATMAATHSNVGTKDFLVSDIVMEPLMRYLPDASIIPYLVEDVPSVENGLLAEDLSSATFRIRDGILFSDGEQLTARDVQFTWEWITNPDNASVNFATWDTIENIEVEDELTAVATFKNPSANWFEPFVGGIYGTIYPAHAFDDDSTNQNEGFLTAPIGTGPYMVESFSPNDEVRLVMNENYWQENAPYFSSVIIKGGGDAASAARAVVQTGEYEYAWNLQVEPAVLEEMTQGDARGEIVTVLGTSVERLHFNFSDPNTEVDGQRSHKDTPHPFLSDLAVRQALNKAVDRQTIADEFYGFGMPPTPNILTGLDVFESPNTSWEYDLDAAAEILDEAGWVMEGDRRVKDGVELSVTYATSVNQVRQKTQAVIKSDWESIGIRTQLEQVDAGIFFDSSAGNEQNISHLYWDITMYTNNPSSPVPASFFLSWYAGPDGQNIAQRENQWQGENYQRYNNPDFDAKYEELLEQTDLEAATEILIELNDILINDVVIIPQVNRAADTYAISTELNNDNVGLSPLELNYWNIANWNRS